MVNADDASVSSSALHIVSDIKAHKLNQESASDDAKYEVGFSDGDEPGASGFSDVVTNGNSEDFEGTEYHLDTRALLVDGILSSYSSSFQKYELNPNPSGILTADILSLPLHVDDARQYIGMCLELLVKISKSQAHPDHEFLIAVGSKLRSFATDVGRNQPEPTTLKYYIDLATEYVVQFKDETIASVAARYLLEILCQILLQFCSEAPHFYKWSSSAMLIFGSVIKLLIPCIEQSYNCSCSQYFIYYIWGDADILNLLSTVAKLTLLNNSNNYLAESSIELTRIETDLLSLFVAMANLVNLQPTVRKGKYDPKLNVYDDFICSFKWKRGLKEISRSHCLSFFSGFVAPGNTLIQEALEDDMPTSSDDFDQTNKSLNMALSLKSRSVRLRNGVFALLKSLFTRTGSLFASNRELTGGCLV